MAAEAAGAARGGEAEAEQHSGRLPENTGETAPPPLAAQGTTTKSKSDVARTTWFLAMMTTTTDY
jgi:hypothetical protein